jgi:hypothetical protein
VIALAQPAEFFGAQFFQRALSRARFSLSTRTSQSATLLLLVPLSYPSISCVPRTSFPLPVALAPRSSGPPTREDSQVEEARRAESSTAVWPVAHSRHRAAKNPARLDQQLRRRLGTSLRYALTCFGRRSRLALPAAGLPHAAGVLSPHPRGGDPSGSDLRSLANHAIVGLAALVPRAGIHHRRPEAISSGRRTSLRAHLRPLLDRSVEIFATKPKSF